MQALELLGTAEAERDEAVCIALDNAAARDTALEGLHRQEVRVAELEAALRRAIETLNTQAVPESVRTAEGWQFYRNIFQSGLAAALEGKG